MTDDSERPIHDKAFCGGKKKQSEGTCTRPAGWGTDHPGTGRCKLHGGCAPSSRVAAKIEVARRAVATYGLPREVTPDVALLEEVHRTAGHVAWLADVVAALQEEDLVWGKTEMADKTATEFSGVDTTYKAVPNTWLILYQQERKHLASVCKDALAAGIAERQVRLAEQQGALVAQVIRAVLADLDLTAEQEARVPELVPRHLRALAG